MITINHLKTLLGELELKHQINEEAQAILIGFLVDPDETSYRDRDGDACITCCLRISEDGRFLSIFAPTPWIVPKLENHRHAVFETLIQIQSCHTLIRFDFCHETIIPNVEIPIDDSSLNASQLKRLISAMLVVIDSFDHSITQACTQGILSDVSAVVQRSKKISDSGNSTLIHLMNEDSEIDGASTKAVQQLLPETNIVEPPQDD